MWSRIGSIRNSSLKLGLGLELARRWLWSSSETGRRFAAVWGNGDYGRLGLRSLDSHWRPVPLLCSAFREQGLRAIACGGAHTLFLTETGCVYATGLNDFGQLGLSDDTTYTTVGKAGKALRHNKAKKASMCDKTSPQHKDITEERRLDSIKEPVEVSGLPKEIVHISAGYYHSGAVTADGELFLWGKNSNGQLGLGKRAPKAVSVPTKVQSLIGMTIKMAAFGSEHSIAVTDRGESLSWGGGEYGRLGHGHDLSTFGFFKNTSEYTPRLIKELEGIKVKSVAAGLLHSACVDENGSVFVFGERPADKVGFGEVNSEKIPSIVSELPYSEEVACGGYHTCVLTSGGELYTWGSNENGCLGIGTTTVFHQPERVQGPFLESTVSQVSCGWKHTAAVSEGNIFTWGWGGSHGTFSVDGHSSGGQLGHGSDVDYIKPRMINFEENVRAVQVSCGFNHSGAILEHV